MLLPPLLVVPGRINHDGSSVFFEKIREPPFVCRRYIQVYAWGTYVGRIDERALYLDKNENTKRREPAAKLCTIQETPRRHCADTMCLSLGKNWGQHPQHDAVE